jgi:hypothetical protein
VVELPQFLLSVYVLARVELLDTLAKEDDKLFLGEGGSYCNGIIYR